jgi:hypothetical protein
MYIVWSCGLVASAVLFYKILQGNNVTMRYPHDTVSKLNAGVYQVIVVSWALYNITFSKQSTLLDESMIGYYIYDILSLLTTQRGRKQYMYFLHHILSIYLINLNILYNVAPHMYTNTLYFTMELSGCAMNWMKLSTEYYPSKKFKIATYTTYGLTRGVVLPIIIIKYCTCIYQPIFSKNVTVFMLIGMYMLSMNWFSRMF